MENLPERKNNRLKDFDYSTAGAYFVTICTKDRKQILSTIRVGTDKSNDNTESHVGCDAHIAPYIELSRYGKVAEKYIKNIPGIDVYAIMPNHIHMIIIIGEDRNRTMRASSPTRSIPQVVKSFKIMVSKECGESIWQRSYYDHIIRNEKDYMEKREYILNNPVRWDQDIYYI